mgnify:CR=1 FL=1
MANAAEMGAYLVQQLQQIAGVSVRGRGLMLGLETSHLAQLIRSQLLEQHKIFTGAASQKNTVRLLPSLGVSRPHCDAFVRAFTDVINSFAS